MLNKKQIEEIREHLDKSQNPLFFFDNDADGLASFLLLQRYQGKGKGIAIKSFPGLSESYTRKLYELNPDYIFILDKPSVEQGFIDEAKKLNIPIVWIDHHDVSKPEDDYVSYYNSFLTDNHNEPVAYSSYLISRKKEDIWIAMIGCIGDGYLPDFIPEFEKKYGELWGKNIKTAFDVLYTTELGNIIKILSFALKDRTTNVINMLRFLMKIKNPTDILDEIKARTILQRFNQINSKYTKLIEKAKNFSKKEVLFFQYGGELSLSADISNELSYLYPDKVIVVAYVKGTKANISLRWKKDVRALTLKAIEGIEGATGGGHEHATGAQVSIEDLPKFKEKLEKLVR